MKRIDTLNGEIKRKNKKIKELELALKQIKGEMEAFPSEIERFYISNLEKRNQTLTKENKFLKELKADGDSQFSLLYSLMFDENFSVSADSKILFETNLQDRQAVEFYAKRADVLEIVNFNVLSNFDFLVYL